MEPGNIIIVGTFKSQLACLLALCHGCLKGSIYYRRNEEHSISVLAGLLLIFEL